MYSNNILNVQESTTILNAHTKKKVWMQLVNEGRKLARRKFKTKAGKIIHRESCERLKWYINKAESVIENDNHKIL